MVLTLVLVRMAWSLYWWFGWLLCGGLEDGGGAVEGFGESGELRLGTGCVGVRRCPR